MICPLSKSIFSSAVNETSLHQQKSTVTGVREPVEQQHIRHRGSVLTSAESKQPLLEAVRLWPDWFCSSLQFHLSVVAHALPARNSGQCQTLLYQPPSLLLISCSQEQRRGTPQGTSLLTISGWRANVRVGLRWTFPTNNLPACSWQMTSVEALWTEG